MRRLSPLILALTLSACAKSEPPPRFAPPTPARSDAEPTEPIEVVELAEPESLADTGLDTSPGAEEAADSLPTAPSSTATPPPTVDEAMCRAACENALALTLAELPDSAIASMRDELTRALRDDCPTRCVAKASLESVRCIGTARTALALASCP